MAPHLVIIGNGIAGITTARHVRKRSDMRITVISAETDHFYSRTALMYIYMGHMRYEDTKPYEDWFWEKNRIDLMRGYVNTIDTDAKKLYLEDGREIGYDKLLIATGSKSNKFGWPGQDLPGVQGLYSYQDLQLMERNTKGISKAVIVGGGLIGIEVGEMLQTRNIEATFLIREEWYWDNVLPKDEAKMITRHIEEHGMQVIRETNLKEILADENGRARAVVTEFDDEIPCEFVALTPGVHPNIDLAKESKIKTDRGVLVNDYLETNIADVYAAGDCAEIMVEGQNRNRIEQLWYTGRLQGEALAKTLCGERTKYDRGVWFNSAKFLDIEYQTYGYVHNEERDGETSFYWQHEDGHHAIRIVYKSATRELVGANFFGIRSRHATWDKWISESRTVDYALENLSKANFDPEFYKRYEPEIVRAYNRDNGKTVKLKQKPSFWSRMLG